MHVQAGLVWIGAGHVQQTGHCNTENGRVDEVVADTSADISDFHSLLASRPSF